MEKGPCGDRELAEAVAQNDEVAVRIFFSAYHPSVYRYVVSLTRNREDAEDLAQEAILQAKAQIRKFRGDSSLKTWVHKIAFHTFTRWAQRRKRQIPEVSGTVPSDPDGIEDLVQSLQSIGPALSHPFVLQEVGGFSLEEIADILSIPVGTVKSRLFTARKRLQALLTSEEILDERP